MDARHVGLLRVGLALLFCVSVARADSADSADSASADASDPLAGRDHWAFRPLADAAPPRAEPTAWPRGPIDEYVLARLGERGLEPAPDADRRTLLRRLSFQIVGLPPSRAELEAFLADDHPDAVERVVERLLASPGFGERWGRHWLDLARYADSNGLDENFLFREAWRYRNWVIDAINAKMPLDRFVLEQVAGDLLPFASVEERDRQRIAAGFLVIGPKVLLGNDPRNQRMEVADEQIDTVGRALLGQTLGCARCHDHKFDPVPTADYYALAGIFTSTRVMERRYMLGQQRVMEQLVGLGPEGDEADAAYETYWRERPQLNARHDRAKAALEHLKKPDAAAFDALAAKHADAVAEEARDAALASEERIAAQEALVARLAESLTKPPPIPPRAMIPTDADAPANERVRVAGQFDRPGDEIPRGFLTVLADEPVEIPDGASGRLQLAQWLTDVESGAGRLTARVLANRVWHHMVGVGLVRTVDNFGRTGETPSHPALLDHLARELISSGWSLEHLVREIALSRTFAMSSRHDEEAHAIDPEVRLLWRAHRRRLDPESLRDAMLATSGRLDLKPMDSTVWYLGDQATAVGANTNRRRTDFPCRSVYLPVIRNDLPELFEAFDFADPHRTTGMRPRTSDAKQALYTLNSPDVVAAAEGVARRVLAAGEGADERESLDARLELLFALVVQASPTEAERAAFAAFVADARRELEAAGDDGALLRAWAMAAQALLASSRFQLLE